MYYTRKLWAPWCKVKLNLPEHTLIPIDSQHHLALGSISSEMLLTQVPRSLCPMTLPLLSDSSERLKPTLSL